MCIRDRFLYYAKFGESGIWKRSLESGEESRLPINIYYWVGWDLARGGIYFLNADFRPNGRIEFFDFANGQSTPIFALDKPFPFFGGLALSPDGKSLLFGQNELNEDVYKRQDRYAGSTAAADLAGEELRGF